MKDRAVGWTSVIQRKVLHQTVHSSGSAVAAELLDVLLIFPAVVSDPEITFFFIFLVMSSHNDIYK